MKNEEKSLRIIYHVTDTLGSNLIYLTTTGQVSMGVNSTCLLGPYACPQKFVPTKKLILAMFKCMVTMAIHNAILLNGGVPTKSIISQLLYSLDN